MAGGGSDFHEILQKLVKMAGLDEKGFVREFSKMMIVDPRTPRDWLRGESGHTPSQDNLEKIVEFFGQKLNLPGLTVRMLRLMVEDFDVELKNLRDKAAPKIVEPVALPYDPPEIAPGHATLLCGTYYLYRCSFLGTSDRILRDVIAVRKLPDPRILEAELRCFPVNRAGQLQAPASELEIYKGHLHKFGKLFTTTLARSDPGHRDWRVRSLYFPVLPVVRDKHYGLTTGYSSNLDEPVSARALAIRINTGDILEQECADGLRTYAKTDPEVAGYEKLIQNRDIGDDYVLTVDKRKTPFSPSPATV